MRKGDGLLVDRGFDVKDLTMRKEAKLIMPPKLKGRKRFTYKELMASRVITRAR